MRCCPEPTFYGSPKLACQLLDEQQVHVVDKRLRASVRAKDGWSNRRGDALGSSTCGRVLNRTLYLSWQFFDLLEAALSAENHPRNKPHNSPRLQPPHPRNPSVSLFAHASSLEHQSKDSLANSKTGIGRLSALETYHTSVNLAITAGRKITYKAQGDP